MQSVRYVRTLLLALAAASAVVGCIVEPIGYGADYAGPAYGPPAPEYEAIGVAPFPGYIWARGYWGWEGGRYAWTSGRWIAPRRGYRWAQPRWERGRGGWRFEGGHWRR